MSNLLRNFSKLLTAAETLVYFACTSLALILPPRLALLPAVRRAIASPSLPRDSAEALRLWRAMDRVSHLWPWETLCLQRSLVLLWLMKRRGFQPALLIGVRVHDEGMEAHAWVELGSVPIGEPANVSSTFIRFDCATQEVPLERQLAMI